MLQAPSEHTLRYHTTSGEAVEVAHGHGVAMVRITCTRFSNEDGAYDR